MMWKTISYSQRYNKNNKKSKRIRMSSKNLERKKNKKFIRK